MSSVEYNNNPLPAAPPPLAQKMATIEPQDEVFNTYFQDQQFIHYPSRQKISLSLSAREAEIVRESWQLMLSDSATDYNLAGKQNMNSSSFSSSLFCHQLYDNLLDARPDLIDMFPSIKHQAVAFAGIMNITVNNLETLEALDSVLEHLGRTHSRILGIEGPFFELMGNALIKTFQDRYIKLEMDFSIELEDCWISLYCFLANSILQSGIDPILQYGKPATAAAVNKSQIYYNKQAQQSGSSLESVTDQETLLADKLSRPTSAASSSRTRTTSSSMKKTTIGNTKKAIRNLSLSSSNGTKTTSTSNMKAKLSMSKDDKKKDGTCIIM